MKVLPLHRKGWGNYGLEPGNREEPDRKPQRFPRRALRFEKGERRVSDRAMRALNADACSDMQGHDESGKPLS